MAAAAAAAAAVNVSGTAVRQSRSPERKVKTHTALALPPSLSSLLQVFFFLLTEGAEKQLSFSPSVRGCTCVLILCCSSSFMG